MRDSSEIEITGFPVPLVQGEIVIRNGKRVAIVPETGLCNSEAELFEIIAKQHSSVAIDPANADLSVEVGPDGVFLGFFTNDGKAALLNLDRLCSIMNPAGAAALTEWATDRRKQAVDSESPR